MGNEPADDTYSTGSNANSNGSSTTGEQTSLMDDRYVSIHRRQLDRIRDDGHLSVRHHVPDRFSKTAPDTKKILASYQDHLHRRTGGEWVETFLPCYKWLKSYAWRSTLPKDIVAGCTVGAMIVPQSMSYAELAGLPVQYGLYSALVPVYAYALFGSSRQLAVGPVAIISLLLSTGLTRILPRPSEGVTDEYLQQYVTLAIQVSFLTGLLYIGMGLLRLGFVTIFLSHAVVSGFTTGAAVIIGTSQLKYIFGYKVPRSDVLQEILKNLFDNIDQFNYKTFLMGSLSIFALLALKTIGKKFPKYKWVRAAGPLAVTALTVLVTWVFNLETKGIPVVGDIPRGFPSYTANLWTPIQQPDKLLTVTISIVVVGFMESIAIAKQLASKHKYQLDSSLELIGLGMSNFLGAMFQSYPVTGSFSRSAVNNDSGAQSGISGIVTASLVALTLLFLTPVFEKMVRLLWLDLIVSEIAPLSYATSPLLHQPLCVLAAIVISGVIGLLDFEEAHYLLKVHRFDFCVWLSACMGTMFLGVEIGLAIAVGVSLLLVIYESAYPHTAVLGRLPGTTIYRNVKQYPEAERYEGIVMVRIDAPIYFANTQNVRDKLQKYEQSAEAELKARGNANTAIQFMILELSPVSHIDTSALHILHDMLDTYKERGIQLCFANPATQVMERFISSGLVDKVGRDHIFVAIQDAVNWCLTQMDTIAISVHGDMVASGFDMEEKRRDVEAGRVVPIPPTEASFSAEDEFTT